MEGVASTPPPVDPVDEPVEPRHPGHRMRIAVVGIALIGTAIVVAVLGSWPAVGQGAQPLGPTARVGTADGLSWSVVATLDGSTRAGWPRPMLARDRDRGICFGFENDVFDPPRPSLARCVDQAAIAALEAHEIVSLMTIEAGADIWHVMAAPSPITMIELSVGDGVDLDDGRLHIDGDVAILRLELASPITTMTWRSGRVAARCTPDAGSISTGQFCPQAL